MLMQVESILLFVEDIHAVAQWYSRLFDTNVEYENPNYAFIRTGSVILSFHPSDEKKGPGHNGQVTYWAVNNFDQALARCQQQGATLYRGPMITTLGAKVAMLLDPFGNPFGLNQSPAPTK